MARAVVMSVILVIYKFILNLSFVIWNNISYQNKEKYIKVFNSVESKKRKIKGGYKEIEREGGKEKQIDRRERESERERERERETKMDWILEHTSGLAINYSTGAKR